MTEFYPGSKQKVKVFNPAKKTAPVEDSRELDLGRGKDFVVKGKITPLYTVGSLAVALNRSPITLRKWEAEGVIPAAPFILPSDDKRGQRRMYSMEHLLGLRKIAQEEGVLNPSAHGKWKDINKTQFTGKAVELFRQLEGN